VRIAFLGSGFTGRFFSFPGDDTLHTSRRRECAGQPGWAVFDSARPETWRALAEFAPDGVVVAFPLSDSPHGAALGHFLLSLSSRLVVIGTTGVLLPVDGEVTDGSSPAPDHPRAIAEERLRTMGATILHAAGLYGPGRNPLDWLRSGRIANSGKVVNLLHGDDLARACRFLLEQFSPAKRLVISDGHPRPWREIIAFAVQRGYLNDPQLPNRPDPTSKRVCPAELFRRGFTLAHPDLFAELEALEGGAATP
jgi:hypothetical protein